MPINLEEDRKPGLPVVKRTALGQKFFGAIVKVDQRDRQRRDESTGTMVPILKPNGRPRKELVITCMTLPGTTAPAGIGEQESVPNEGDLVRLILKGKAFVDWIESKNALGRTIQVGDVVEQVTNCAQVYDAQGNPSGAELTDQAAVNAVPRGRSVGIYGPVKVRAAKEDSEWVAKAEAAYHSLQERISVEPGGGSLSGFSDEEPPF